MDQHETKIDPLLEWHTLATAAGLTLTELVWDDKRQAPSAFVWDYLGVTCRADADGLGWNVDVAVPPGSETRCRVRLNGDLPPGKMMIVFACLARGENPRRGMQSLADRSDMTLVNP